MAPQAEAFTELLNNNYKVSALHHDDIKKICNTVINIIIDILDYVNIYVV